ncbi:MAG: penicillin-binding protein 2 [Chloroflexota bacterium]
MLDSPEPRITAVAAGRLFKVAVVVLFGILAAQLWRLQIVEGPQLRERADNNRIRVSPIPAPRGVIYDRNGVLLAANAPVFAVSIVPADLPSRNERQVFDRLGGMLGMPPNDIALIVDRQSKLGDRFSPVLVKSNVPRDTALMIEQSHIDLPGVSVSVDSARRYSEGALLSHVLGYTGPISPALLSPAEYKQKLEKEGYTINDRIGSAGVEDTYEPFLRGRPGRRMYEVEASGREIAELRVERPEPGKNLKLTIDVELQRTVTTILREGLKNGNVGVVIVSEVRTGDILAMVSLPTFDSNVFTDDTKDEELTRLLKDPEQPFFHRAIAGNYPPGSTFKLVTGLGALQEGVATRDTIIESKGVLYVPHDYYPAFRQPFPDWAPLGRLNYVQAIANSSNIYFFYLGGGYEQDKFTGLGNERLARYARMLGYGARSGLDIAGESSGTIPDEAWKLQRIGEKWVKGDTYNMSIGQGYVEATPIQVHNMTTAIANGGVLLRPRVVREILDSDGRVVESREPAVIRRLDVDPRYIRTTIEGMEAGFSAQLLRDYRIPGVRVAGKTGTAEFGQATNPQGELPTHGWFTGFAPVENPRYAVTVFVERGSSSRDAAPIAARVLRTLFKVPEDVKAPPLPQLPIAVPQTVAGAGRAVAAPAAPAPAAARPGSAAPTATPAPIVAPANTAGQPNSSGGGRSAPPAPPPAGVPGFLPRTPPGLAPPQPTAGPAAKPGR